VPIGSMEDLDAAQEEDYVNFYKTFYVPSNATLSIAGDLDIAQTKEWVQKYFGSIPTGQAINLHRDYLNLSDEDFLSVYSADKSILIGQDYKNPSTKEARALIAKQASISTKIVRPENYKGKMTSVVVDTVYDNIQLPGLFITYNYPNETNSDFHALEMLHEILSGGTSSRLNKSLVEKKELAVNAFSFPFGMEAGGVGIFGAISSDGTDLNVLLDEFNKQINTIKSELVSQEEFDKIRNQKENEIVSSNASIAGIAENLANNFVYYSSTDRINTLIDGYMNVSREDIQRVANKYLTEDARLILYYLPKEK